MILVCLIRYSDNIIVGSQFKLILKSVAMKETNCAIQTKKNEKKREKVLIVTDFSYERCISVEFEMLKQITLLFILVYVHILLCE